MKRTSKLKRAGPLVVTAAAILSLSVFGCATVPERDTPISPANDSGASEFEMFEPISGGRDSVIPDISFVQPQQAQERPVPPGMLLLPVPLLEDGISTPSRPEWVGREFSPEGLALPIPPPAASENVAAEVGAGDVGVRDSASPPTSFPSTPVPTTPAATTPAATTPFSAAPTTTAERPAATSIAASQSTQPQRDEPEEPETPERTALAEANDEGRVALAADVGSDTEALQAEATGTVFGSELNEVRRGNTASTEEVIVVLPGEGWLYVGREYGDGSVEFLGKQTVRGNDEFRFRLGSEGDYRLWFQQQDSRSGGVSNERLWLVAQDHVPSAEVVVSELPLVDDTALVAVPPGADGTASALDARGHTELPLQTADYADGASDDDDDQALGDRGEPADDVVVVDRDYWVGLASSGSAEAGDARRRLQAMSLDGSGEEIDEALDLLAAYGEATPEDYSDSITALIEDGELDRASGWTDRYLSSGTASRYGTDRLLYLLAQRLEEPGPERDLRLSLYYYGLLMDHYPVSRYWEPSRERTEYLNRHYFEVR